MLCCKMGQNSAKPKQDLDDLLKLEAERAALQFKVLLLGAGESGKSTVIKQLKLIYQRKDMNDKWFMSWVPILHANTFQCMQTLIQTAEKFDYKLEGQYAESAQKILAIKIEEEPVLTEALAIEIDELWKHEAIQKTYQRRSEYWLLESAVYYFDHAAEMAKDGFKPSEEHIVMARARTTGIIITEIEREDLLWRIVDVGGQRSERKKWIRCFDDVKAIVFVVNLAGYNSVLFEDQKKNRMKEEIELFTETVSNPVFKHTPIFLFLNKKDLFEEHIRKFPLTDLFPDFKGGENIHESIEFIASQFRSKLEASRQENFKYWPISARYKKDVKYSFQEFMDIIRKANLPSIQKALTNLKKEKKKGSTPMKPGDLKKQEAERLKQEKTKSNISIGDSVGFHMIAKYGVEDTGEIYRVYLTDFPNFKSHPKEKIEAKFCKNSFEFIIRDWNKVNYKLAVTNTYDQIVPEECSYVQNNSGAIIKLKKVKEKDWPAVFTVPKEELKMSADSKESTEELIQKMYDNGDGNIRKLIEENYMSSKKEREENAPKSSNKPIDDFEGLDMEKMMKMMGKK